MVGSAVGHLVAPGLGGIAAGALIANLFDRAVVNESAGKKRVFVSFDYDNDRKVKDLFVGQCRNSRSPFEVTDVSLKEAAPERDWERKAERKISRADLVIVLLGAQTYRASGVLKEVRMARRLGVPCVQLVGYSDRACPRVKRAGRVIDWSWNSLQSLLE